MQVDATRGFPVSLSSAYYKETLLNDIRRAREKYQGDELAKELARIRLRLDNTEVLTSDVIINLLLSYRDIQVGAPLLEASVRGAQPWPEEFIPHMKHSYTGVWLANWFIGKSTCLGHRSPSISVVMVTLEVLSPQMATLAKPHAVLLDKRNFELNSLNALYARHCFRLLANPNSFNPLGKLMGCILHHPHFTDEAQRS